MDIPPFKEFKKNMDVSIQLEAGGEPKGELIKLRVSQWSKSAGTRFELIGLTAGDVQMHETYALKFKGVPWRGTFERINESDGIKTFTFAAIISDTEFWA